MIINFGSINVDFIYSVSSMPQAGQTILARELRIEPGGKGANQAVAAARDGVEVVMVGAVGQDGIASFALQNFTGSLSTERVKCVDQPTGSAAIHIDKDGQNMITVAAGANLEARSSWVSDQLLRRSKIVLMQMENDVAEIETLIRRVRAVGGFSLLNLAPPVPISPEVLSLCDMIVVNEDEAEALGRWLGCEPSAEALAARLGNTVLRTLGGEGAEASSAGQVLRVKALSVMVGDTTAAGDCFVGVLAASLARGASLEDAMTRASAAAGITCSRVGSQGSIPYADETDIGTSRGHAPVTQAAVR